MMVEKTFISIFAIFLLCFIFIKFLNNNDNDKNNKNELNNIENYQNKSILGHFEYSNFNNFEDTIFEESLRNEFDKNNSNIVCNVLPTLKKEDCKDMNGLDIQINIFPVHILEVDPKLILAVFNNGYIYKKNKLDDKYWSGPLENSLPNNTIPLRMISMDSNLKLLGVGYDNNLYRKVKDSKDLNVESQWELVPMADDLIYVLYETKLKEEGYNPDESKIKDDLLIGINKIGLLTKIKYNDLGSRTFEPLVNDDFKVLKIYFEKNGYMIAIGTDFNLYRKNTKNWEEAEFNIFNKNESKLLDVVYDSDAKMFGLVFMERMNVVEMMKQKMIHYLSSFTPLEMLPKKRSDIKMNFNDRLKAKTGVDKLIYKLVDDYGYNNVDEVKSRLEIDDIGKLRTLCKNRGFLTNKKYQNFDILNKIQSQNKKIDNMNSIISEMFKQDINRNKMQESILFL